MGTMMIARDLRSYNGRALKPGDLFEVEDERHVRTLALSRKAERAEPAENSPAIDAAPAKEPRRSYRRRDMKAES